MKKTVKLILALCILLSAWNSGFSRSWDDLDAGEHEIFGSEREEKFPVKALFMEMESWEGHYSFMLFWLFKYTDYPRYTSTRFLPFYYGLDSKIDNRSMTVLPPLLTYLERDNDEYTKYILFPLYRSYYSKSEYGRTLLFPFIWWGGSNPQNGKWKETYDVVFPVWFHMNNAFSEDSGESVWINPLFFSYSQWTKDETYEYYRWFPLIPLTFHIVDRQGGHRNYLWLFDYSWTTDSNGVDSLERFWILPLFLWGRGDDGYTYILPPEFIYNKYSNGDYYCHLLPFFSVWRDTYAEKTEQVITPLFAKRNVYDAKTGEETYSNFFFPIIPLFFTSYDRSEGYHKNIAWLIDWEKNPDSSMKSLWLAPLVFHQFKDFGYRYYIPFFFRDECSGDYGYSWSILHYHEWSVNDEIYMVAWLYYQEKDKDGNYSYRHLLPFFAWWESKGPETTSQVITPLFGTRSVTDTKTGEETYSNFFFPLIPLYFTSTDRNEGSHTNIAWLLDWERNTDGSFRTFWLFPFIFHEFKDYGYRLYFPFFVMPARADEKNGFSWGMFHYYNWSPSEETFWAWLYYSNEKYGTPEQGKETGELPVTEYFRYFLPVYWSWKNHESTGSLILPVIFNYEDKYTKLHINLTGIAYKTFTNPFSPDLAVGLEKKDENWYLDTDVSWLYDMFSVSWRVPVTGKEKIGDSKTEDKGEGTVAIDKKSTSRDDSHNFFGWEAVFGWMAYKHADTRYHFRVLPLAWFTWDNSSQDRMNMILPFYLSYYSEETKEGYFVLAPFYASQTESESFSRGYLINLYWDEYDAQKNYREKTILWPLVNWHYSPDSFGFRVFPVFWYADWKEDEKSISRSISLLHYSMSIDDSKGENIYRKHLNPLYYLKSSVNENAGEYTFFAPVIPVYYYGESTENGENGLVVTDLTTVSLFHIYNEYTVKNNSESFESSSLLVPIIPLFYHGTYGDMDHWNLLGIIDRCTGRDYSRFFVLPFYYSSTAGDAVHTNVLGIIDSYSDKDYSRLFVFPLFYASKTGNVKYRNILGIIDWESGAETGGSAMFLPFFMWHGGEENSLTLPLFLSYFSSGKDWSKKFIAGTYWYSSPGYTHQDILLLYDHTWSKSSSGETDNYDFLLSTVEVDISPEVWEMRMAWGALFEYTKYGKSGGYDFDALLGFAGFDNENGYFHSRIIPLWYYQRESTTDWWLVIPPMLSLFSEQESGDFDLALLGVLYYRNENVAAGEDRRMILLGTIYNEVKKPERRYHARGSMWGILWDYETEEETGFTKFTILKGLYKYVDRNGKSENTFFWFL